tara:strand:- start:2253 stop:2552 length:300 start_codon:yes stop_codon:yes gene_type:complete
MKKLSDLAATPELTSVIIDDEQLVEKYGDSLEFFIYDKLPISTYTKLASLDTSNAGEMYNAVKDLILDEHGHPVIHEDKTLPMDVMTSAVVKVTEQLGK